ncbi:hypothetical protein [Haladaptatus sp. NG-SE-30]
MAELEDYRANDHSEDDHSTDDSAEDDHLNEVPDGSGCTEIWEHLSERRGADDVREE